MAQLETGDDAPDLPDPEAPDEADTDATDTSEWIDCPECGKQIYEDTERCPYCGEWVTKAAGRKGWVLIAALLVIAATLATWMW